MNLRVGVTKTYCARSSGRTRKSSLVIQYVGCPACLQAKRGGGGLPSELVADREDVFLDSKCNKQNPPRFCFLVWNGLFFLNLGLTKSVDENILLGYLQNKYESNSYFSVQP